MDVERADFEKFPQFGDKPHRYRLIKARMVVQVRGQRMHYVYVVHRSGVFPEGAGVHDFEGSDEYLTKQIELKEVRQYAQLRPAA